MPKTPKPAPDADPDENALAAALGRAPEFLRQNAATVLLVIVAAVAAFVIVRQRTGGAADQNAAVGQSLARAEDNLQRLQQLGAAAGRVPAEQYASLRDEWSGAVRAGVEDVLKTAAESDAQRRSAALAARGDLNWTLAAMPVPPEAATREILKPARPADEYRETAATDWNLVLKLYPRQRTAVADARFGLAAAAENRGEFDAAAEQYRAITDDKSSLPMHADLAKRRLELLAEYRSPVRFGPPTSRPTTVPSTEPAGQSTLPPVPFALPPTGQNMPTTRRIQIRRPTTGPASRPAP